MAAMPLYAARLSSTATLFRRLTFLGVTERRNGRHSGLRFIPNSCPPIRVEFALPLMTYLLVLTSVFPNQRLSPRPLSPLTVGRTLPIPPRSRAVSWILRSRRALDRISSSTDLVSGLAPGNLNILCLTYLAGLGNIFTPDRGLSYIYTNITRIVYSLVCMSLVARLLTSVALIRKLAGCFEKFLRHPSSSIQGLSRQILWRLPQLPVVWISEGYELDGRKRLSAYVSRAYFGFSPLKHILFISYSTDILN